MYTQTKAHTNHHKHKPTHTRHKQHFLVSDFCLSLCMSSCLSICLSVFLSLRPCIPRLDGIVRFSWNPSHHGSEDTSHTSVSLPFIKAVPNPPPPHRSMGALDPTRICSGGPRAIQRQRDFKLGLLLDVDEEVRWMEPPPPWLIRFLSLPFCHRAGSEPQQQPSTVLERRTAHGDGEPHCA